MIFFCISPVFLRSFFEKKYFKCIKFSNFMVYFVCSITGAEIIFWNYMTLGLSKLNHKIILEQLFFLFSTCTRKCERIKFSRHVVFPIWKNYDWLNFFFQYLTTLKISIHKVAKLFDQCLLLYKFFKLCPLQWPIRIEVFRILKVALYPINFDFLLHVSILYALIIRRGWLWPFYQQFQTNRYVYKIQTCKMYFFIHKKLKITRFKGGWMGSQVVTHFALKYTKLFFRRFSEIQKNKSF